jgi:hypothetical protein
MDANALQSMLFQHIKARLDPHLSLVDEVADVLEISIDSAYRRIRGEKKISLEEISKIAARFQISIDQLLHLKNGQFKIFSGNYVTPENFSFEAYLKKMLETFAYLNTFQNRELIHFCKDLVIFYYFPYPELAMFKNFAWMKTILNFPVFKHQPFSCDLCEPEVVDLFAKVARQYSLIPGTEIMNVSNIHTTLYQIEYYKTARMFRSEADLKTIYTQLHNMVNHIEAQAEVGLKFLPGEKENKNSATYNLFVNDFVIGDNSYLATIDGNKISFLVHSHLNYLSTSDEAHTSYHHQFLNNIILKSTLLSKSSEKLRAGFFYLIHEQIEMSKENKMTTFGKI